MLKKFKIKNHSTRKIRLTRGQYRTLRIRRNNPRPDNPEAFTRQIIEDVRDAMASGKIKRISKNKWYYDLDS